MHICYGYGIEANLQWKATLGDVWDQYEAILPALAGSDIDQVSLEFAGSRVPLEVIRLLDGKKDVLVGAIDVTTLTAEAPEEVASRDPPRRWSSPRPNASSPAPIAAWSPCPNQSLRANSKRSAPARRWFARSFRIDGFT